AWTKDRFFPSDRTIARKTGLSRGHVQRCLGRVERAGWIGRQQDGRRRYIWLLWRRPGWAGPRPRPAPAREAAGAPAREAAGAPARDRNVGVVKPEAEPGDVRARPPLPATVGPEVEGDVVPRQRPARPAGPRP